MKQIAGPERLSARTLKGGQSPRPTFTTEARRHRGKPANAPRHRLPGRTDKRAQGRVDSPPDSGGAGAVSDGGGYRTLMPTPYPWWEVAGAMISRRTEIRMPSCMPGPKGFGRQGQNSLYIVPSVPRFVVPRFPPGSPGSPFPIPSPSLGKRGAVPIPSIPLSRSLC
jgi:hypothetical protein